VLVIKAMLRSFGLVSGLRVNFRKSIVGVVGISVYVSSQNVLIAGSWAYLLSTLVCLLEETPGKVCSGIPWWKRSGLDYQDGRGDCFQWQVGYV